MNLIILRARAWRNIVCVLLGIWNRTRNNPQKRKDRSYSDIFLLFQEYDAYKRHMSTLLGKEKELNNKLRVLIG